MSDTEKQIRDALASYTDPYLGKNLIDAKALKSLDVTDALCRVVIELGFPAQRYAKQLRDELLKRVAQVAGARKIDIEIGFKIISHSVQRGVKALPNVKNTIAVASGKGGVGKSTTAVNLALALASEGARVGILDADIYGPSQPRMLGSTAKPESRDGRSMEPIMAHGVQSMSIGYLIDEESPMIWRGPMVTQAL